MPKGKLTSHERKKNKEQLEEDLKYFHVEEKRRLEKMKMAAMIISIIAIIAAVIYTLITSPM